MATHTDPAFYIKNGFCRTECHKCAELDQEEALPEGEAMARGLVLGLEAVMREEDPESGVPRPPR